MYNLLMLLQPFSNKRWGGGGEGRSSSAVYSAKMCIPMYQSIPAVPPSRLIPREFFWEGKVPILRAKKAAKPRKSPEAPPPGQIKNANFSRDGSYYTDFWQHFTFERVKSPSSRQKRLQNHEKAPEAPRPGQIKNAILAETVLITQIFDNILVKRHFKHTVW